MRRFLASVGIWWVVSALAQAQAPVRAGTLLGCWSFEEKDGLAINEAVGRVGPGAILNEGRGVTRVPGRSGMALEFAGGDLATRGNAGCVQFQGMEAVDWGKGLTVEAWVRFNRLERSATYEIVSNTTDDRGPGWRFMLSWQGLWLRTGEGGGGTVWGASSNPSATRFETGPWYHLAATYDGSIFRVYVDGVLAGESAAGLKLPAGEPVINLGSYRGGYAYGLDGVVDEVRLYDYARSAAEIVAAAKIGGG
jgi:hypothetical protein